MKQCILESGGAVEVLAKPLLIYCQLLYAEYKLIDTPGLRTIPPDNYFISLEDLSKFAAQVPNHAPSSTRAEPWYHAYTPLRPRRGFLLSHAPRKFGGSRRLHNSHPVRSHEVHRLENRRLEGGAEAKRSLGRFRNGNVGNEALKICEWDLFLLGWRLGVHFLGLDCSCAFEALSLVNTHVCTYASDCTLSM